MQSSIQRPWLRFYSKSIPPSLEYPEIPLQSFLSETGQKYGSRSALNFEGKEVTYRELDDLANKFANGLVSLGIGKVSKVALILPNIPQFVFCFYGALKAGATLVPCNPLYKSKELEFQLSDSECDSVVILNNIIPPNDFYSEFEKCRPNLKSLKHVFTTSLTDFLPGLKKRLAGPVAHIRVVQRQETTDLMSFISTQSTEETDQHKLNINPREDVAVLQYTGGTTGVSKGAMLTHFNLLTNAIASNVWSELMDVNERVLAVAPFFHIYGLTNGMNAPIRAGQEIVLLPQFRVKEVMETIHKEKITMFPGVSTMYVAMVNHPDINKYSIRSVKRCISGAAPLPYEVQKKFNEITGGSLVEGYGLTEASPVTHCNPFGEGALVKSGSIGIPFPDTDAKIVDLETGTKDIPIGEVGELAVRGPQVMKGYWKRPDETANVFRDGWLLTGDIARMDDDGYFYIVDRKKDMIDASGFKVWPREVEEVLYTHPAVKEAAIVGVKDPYRGENVKAIIVLKDKNNNPGPDAFKTYCKERMVAYKVPRLFEFRDELPKTLVGKVLRRKLREEANSGESSP